VHRSGAALRRMPAAVALRVATERPARVRGASVRPQRFAGTDRQVRGLLMAVLRGTAEPVRRAALDAVWPEPVQRVRALDSLVADGLVDPLPDGRFALPGHLPSPVSRPSPVE
jgi:hypothetical protein